jgi:hypothetical protein
MAATYQIIARRMDYGIHGGRHIGSVKLLNGTILTRDQVISYMRQGVAFTTYVPSTAHHAKVRLMQCVHCRTTYITTSADAFKDDNLDHLPTY